MGRSGVFILVIVLFGTFSFRTSATETLGVLSVEELLLRPLFLLREGQDAEFNLGATSFALGWKMDSNISARVRVGQKELLNIPNRFFERPATEDFGLVEGYGQYVGEYGRIRFGLQPVELGVEGSKGESELYFERPLTYTMGILPLRDLGLRYEVANNGYYSRFMVHNGEGLSNPDGRMWYSASWGWSRSATFDVGVSGYTGTTKPASTAMGDDTLAGVDVNREALWRSGLFYVKWRSMVWRSELEYLYGTVLQGEDKKTDFYSGHVDIIYGANRKWGMGLRYDVLEPNATIKDDDQQKISMAFSLQNETRTSMLLLLLSKLIEEPNTANDELRLIWRLTPSTPN